MIARREITKGDLERAAQINDAVALEHGLTEEGAKFIANQLGLDLLGTAKMGADHALRSLKQRPTLAEAQAEVTHAFTMGVMTSLRAVEMMQRCQ